MGQRKLSGESLKFLRDEGGQATVEYILLLAVVVGGAAALMRTILAAVDRGVLVFGGALEKNLKTGRTTVSIWRDQP